MRNILALTALLAGCATSGVMVTDNQIAKLRPGHSTEADAVQLLGPPTMRSRLADGSVLLQYHFAEAKVRPASMIPVVGLFAGGTDVRTNAFALHFGADGRLMTTTSSAGTTSTGSGPNASADPPRK